MHTHPPDQPPHPTAAPKRASRWPPRFRGPWLLSWTTTFGPTTCRPRCSCYTRHSLPSAQPPPLLLLPVPLGHRPCPLHPMGLLALHQPGQALCQRVWSSWWRAAHQPLLQVQGEDLGQPQGSLWALPALLDLGLAQGQPLVLSYRAMLNSRSWPGLGVARLQQQGQQGQGQVVVVGWCMAP